VEKSAFAEATATTEPADADGEAEVDGEAADDGAAADVAAEVADDVLVPLSELHAARARLAMAARVTAAVRWCRTGSPFVTPRVGAHGVLPVDGRSWMHRPPGRCQMSDVNRSLTARAPGGG
jgi:hypothetical protein